MSHRCPAAGCTKRVRDDVWACRDHWWSLPHRIRARLSRPADPLAPVDAHDAARADAVAYWDANAPQTTTHR